MKNGGCVKYGQACMPSLGYVGNRFLINEHAYTITWLNWSSLLCTRCASASKIFIKYLRIGFLSSYLVKDDWAGKKS